MKNLKKPSKESVKQVLISSAWERQKLGLSKTEYDALSPFEIKCELEALNIIQEEKKQILQIIDEHFARLELLANGFSFSGCKTVDDFKILKSNKTTLTDRQRKINNKKNFEMAVKLKALQDKIKTKRNQIRASRKI
jgi:hypothetical protein